MLQNTTTTYTLCYYTIRCCKHLPSTLEKNPSHCAAHAIFPAVCVPNRLTLLCWAVQKRKKRIAHFHKVSSTESNKYGGTYWACVHNSRPYWVSQQAWRSRSRARERFLSSFRLKIPLLQHTVKSRLSLLYYTTIPTNARKRKHEDKRLPALSKKKSSTRPTHASYLSM